MKNNYYFSNLKISIPPWKIYARMGGFADPSSKTGKKDGFIIPPEIEKIINSTIQIGYKLIHVKGALKELIIKKSKPVSLEAVSFQNTDFIIHSKSIAKLLKNKKKAYLLGVTVGEKIMKTAEKLAIQGKITESFILDSFASEAVEEAAEELTRYLQKKSSKPLTFRFACGYGDWRLSDQPKILKLLNGKRLGITTNKAFMLIPQKSITGILGQ